MNKAKKYLWAIYGPIAVKLLREIVGIRFGSCQTVRQPEQRLLMQLCMQKKEKFESDNNILVTDDTPECQALWEMAVDNVFELANADDL